MSAAAAASAPLPPHLTYLRIRNYRALRDVELRDLTPLSVLIGPNGSGKSTVLDALAFLAEAVGGNLTQAWEKRNRFQGMRTRGGEKEWYITFEMEAYLSPTTPRLRYYIKFDERSGMVLVSDEALREPGGERETIIRLTDAFPIPTKFAGFDGAFRMNVYDQDTESPSIFQSPSDEPIISRTAYFPEDSEQSAPKTLVLVRLLTSYRHFHLTDNHQRGISDAGPRERLSATGDNLPNVLYYLHLHHRPVLDTIIGELKRQIPALADVITEVTSDERLLLRFRDAGFEKSLPAAVMSDGTLRLTALLTLLHEPNPAGLLGLEEPESELHPRLLPGLAEALTAASGQRQLLVATHSPALLNALAPQQVWILHRAADGYTQATRAADLPGIPAMVAEGALLGDLWRSNFFDVGDPLAPSAE